MLFNLMAYRYQLSCE